MLTDELKAKRARLVAELDDMRERLRKSEEDLAALDRVLTMLAEQTGQTKFAGVAFSGEVTPASPAKPKMVIPQNLPLQRWILEAAKQLKGDFDRTMLVKQIVANHPDRANEIRRDSVGAILGKLHREKVHGIVRVSGGVGKGANMYHLLPQPLG